MHLEHPVEEELVVMIHFMPRQLHLAMILSNFTFQF